MSAVDSLSPASQDLAGRHQGRAAMVAGALARRSIIGVYRVPVTVIPTVIMPIFFTLAFSGAFSALVHLPGFPTDNILNWMAPFAVMQGASFAGLGASFAVGRDLENGFYDRLLLAPAPRRSLVAGPLLYSLARALLPLCTVVPIAMLGGARILGGVAGFLSLMVAAEGLAVVAGLWGLGVTYRLRTQRAGSLVQTGIFVTLFLSIGQVPLEAMTGWLHWVAVRNPFTYVLKMARQGFLGPVTWANTWPGLVALAVSGLLLGWYAWRGFRTLDR
jgi:ABC-2 type transport system permease protein